MSGIDERVFVWIILLLGIIAAASLAAAWLTIHREQKRAEPILVDDVVEEIKRVLPPGSMFFYLGRPCVVMRYADEAEADHTGTFGMVYEYSDTHGRIHRNCCVPRDLPAMQKATFPVVRSQSHAGG